MEILLGNKIKSARILNALSQQKLADKTSVSKQMISKYEKGESKPSSPVLIELAKALGVKIDYFFTQSFEVDLGAINFRKKSKLTQTRLNSIKEEVKIRLSNYLEIEDILQIKSTFGNSVAKQKVTSLEDIEKVVLHLRNEWEIGLDPLHNIIQLLEDLEIKVIEIEEKENLLDGMAAFVDDKYPVIVVNKIFGIERKRFTLLHELGHLLLDLPECDEKTEETYCNQFASEFLFPTQSVYREFGLKRDRISFKELEPIQRKYGISIQAIIYRLVNVGVLPKNTIEGFYKRMNFDADLKAYVNQERFETAEFSKRYEQLVYRALTQELISISKASSLLGVSINDINTKALV